MRYINIDSLEEQDDWPPNGWEALVNKAEEELRNLPTGKTRADIFAKHSHVWSKVKEYYREISHEKCWYCETRTDRHRGDIDHYRPKGGVTGTNHPGYWWLAFNWRNWRFACELCNSKLTDHATGIVGGKGNDFPLIDVENRRIWNECDYEELLDENPLLLDPTEQEDPLLLTFRSDGRPAPSMADENSIGYKRAIGSIRIYHLDHSKLNRVRRRIYIQIRNLVRDIQRYQSKWEINQDPSARASAKQKMKELGKMIAPNAEYSATARAYLREYREKEGSNWDWVDRLLTAS